VQGKRNPNLGWVLTIASSFLFGLNAATSKVLVHAGFTPNFIVGYRSTATAVLALFLLLAWNPKLLKVTWREIPMLIVFGVLGISMMQWTYTNGVSRLPVGISLLIEYLASVGVPIVNWLLFRKKAGRGIWLGIVLAMAGVTVVSQFWHATLDPVGMAYAFGAMGCVIFYFITSERMQKSRDSYSLLFYSMAASAIFWWLVVHPSLAEQPKLTDALNLGGNLAGITVPMWAGLAWLGVFGSFVPMLFNYLALRHLHSTGVGLASISEVVFAFIFGAIWLGESITGIQLAGAVLVIAGIVMAQLSSSPIDFGKQRKTK
jgi:drug/metabolite transporter (DMT)-like permease